MKVYKLWLVIVDTGLAVDSVCPKGWRLPISGREVGSGVAPTASGSICPTNWSLPDFTEQVGVKNGTAPSYNNLTAAYGIVADTEKGVNRILAIPLSFPRAGDFYDGGLNYRSGSGYGVYWSSRPNGGTNAYGLYFVSTANIYRGSGPRRNGRSVRCVVAGGVTKGGVGAKIAPALSLMI